MYLLSALGLDNGHLVVIRLFAVFLLLGWVDITFLIVFTIWKRIRDIILLVTGFRLRYLHVSILV